MSIKINVKKVIQKDFFYNKKTLSIEAVIKHLEKIGIWK